MNFENISVVHGYDLTFSSGPGGEHCTMIMGEGKNPAMFHLLKLAEIGGIENQMALQIVDEVKVAASRWQEHAKIAGVSPRSLKRIQTALNHVKKML